MRNTCKNCDRNYEIHCINKGKVTYVCLQCNSLMTSEQLKLIRKRDSIIKEIRLVTLTSLSFIATKVHNYLSLENKIINNRKGR